MPKYNSLEEYVSTFDEQALQYYGEISKIMNTINDDVKVQLFAGQVAFYIEEFLGRTMHSSPLIVMSFLKDHVNVFALKNGTFKTRLPEYKFTTKNTMQIYYDKELKIDVLKELFLESMTTRIIEE